MAEIKSTLELALERTQRLSMTATEKKTLREKEISEKASRLFHRYMDGYSTGSEILKEIERADQNLRIAIEKELLSQLTGALTLDSSTEEGERVIAGIESLTGRGLDASRDRFQDLARRYAKEADGVKEQVGIQLVEELKNQGIEGSAVEPRCDEDPLYKKEMGILRERYDVELSKLKKNLTS